MKELLRRVNRTPWFIFLSRLCLAVGTVMLVLLGIHMAQNGADFLTDLTRITNSGRRTDAALLSLFVFFSGYGFILVIGCPEVRKKVMICVGCGFALAMGLSFFRPGTGDWLFALTMAAPGFAAAVFKRIYGGPATEVWQKEHPEPNAHPSSLSAAMMKKAYAPRHKKLTFSDIAPIPFLLFMILYVYVGATRYIEKRQAAVWHFIAIGLILFVLILYVIAILDRPIPISLLTCRFLWGNLGAIIVLHGVHIASTFSFEYAIRTADLTSLMASSFWPDQALAGAVFLFCLVSLLLTLSRRETRKLFRWSMALYPVVITAGMSLDLLSDAGKYSWSVLAGDVTGLSWPLFMGIWALSLERLFGGEIRAEWMAGKEKKRIRSETAARTQMNTAKPATSGSPAARPGTQTFPRPISPGMSSTPPVKPAANPAVPKKPAPSPMPPPDREKELSKARADYERRRQMEEQQKAPERKDPSLSAREQLQETARRLYPGGETLGTLEGQRQLLVWLAEGVLCLRKIRRTDAGRALMDPNLPDDPAAFLPVLDRVVKEAGARLEERLWEDDRNWRDLSAEALTGGWFALNMYARISSAPEIFQLAADGIADYFSREPGKMDELRKLCDSGQNDE